ncbi:NAD(P)-dependent oxidoreductase, partial [Longimonas halophila]
MQLRKTSARRGLIESDGTMRLPAGNAATGFVDARDIAAVSVAALTEDGHAGAAYTITGPEALTYHEAADVLSEAWSRDIRYEP